MITQLSRSQKNYNSIKKTVYNDTIKGLKIWAKRHYDDLALVIDTRGTLKLAYNNELLPRKNHNKTPDEISADNEFIKKHKKVRKKA